MSSYMNQPSRMLLVCLSLSLLVLLYPSTTMAQSVAIFDNPAAIPALIVAAPTSATLTTPQNTVTYNGNVISVWFLGKGTGSAATPCTYTLSTLIVNGLNFIVRATTTGTIVLPIAMSVAHINSLALPAQIGDLLSLSLTGPAACQLGVAPNQPGFDVLSSSDTFVPGQTVRFDVNQISGGVAKLIIGATLLITSVVRGDPNFSGLQGQSFQVHGIPNSIFNLVSSPTFQLNSRFAYLSSGVCNYNNTVCWSHPGTYLDQLGFNFGKTSSRLKVVAGPHEIGMRAFLGDVEMEAGKSAVTVSTFTVPFLDNNNSTYNVVSSKLTPSTTLIQFLSKDQLLVQNADWVIRVTNSDEFFNLDINFLQNDVLIVGSESKEIINSNVDDSSTFPKIPLHGFVGQTWKNVEYKSKRLFEGEPLDYELSSGDLFGTDFVFNQFTLNN